MGKLDGESSVVVGVGTGMGRSIALALAREGSDIALISRTEHKLLDICSEVRLLGRKCVVAKADATKKEELNVAKNKIISELGEPSILIYNAGGFFTLDKVSDVSEELLDHAYNLHLKGLLFSVQTFLEGIKRRQGSIIVIAASPATMLAGNIAYTATKAAQIWFVKKLAKELQAFNVRVNSVSPGPTSHDKSSVKDLVVRLGSTEPYPAADVGEAVVFLTSRLSPRITGEDIILDGGLSIPHG